MGEIDSHHRVDLILDAGAVVDEILVRTVVDDIMFTFSKIFLSRICQRLRSGTDDGIQVERTTIFNAVQVSDRVGFTTSTSDGAGGETRSLTLPPLRGRRNSESVVSLGWIQTQSRLDYEQIGQLFGMPNSRSPGGRLPFEAHEMRGCPKPSRHSAGSGEPSSLRRYQSTTSSTPTPLPEIVTMSAFRTLAAALAASW